MEDILKENKKDQFQLEVNTLFQEEEKNSDIFQIGQGLQINSESEISHEEDIKNRLS